MTLMAWILFGVVGFAFLLAVQMRFLISVSLRRALAAEFGGDYRAPEHIASVQATRNATSGDRGADWLAGKYPQPLAYLRLARRVSYTAPMGLFLLLAFMRFGLRMF
ncbi:MAG: hypothetical protein R3C13_14500 [Hyphomonas sp.]|uniref:hypothetical protein n=1 Tax=Hyphomonas sp. TaxID=87 RepID=UPI0035288A57